jgi:hypothetical protein
LRRAVEFQIHDKFNTCARVTLSAPSILRTRRCVWMNTRNKFFNSFCSNKNVYLWNKEGTTNAWKSTRSRGHTGPASSFMLLRQDTECFLSKKGQWTGVRGHYLII